MSETQWSPKQRTIAHLIGGPRNDTSVDITDYGTQYSILFVERSYGIELFYIHSRIDAHDCKKHSYLVKHEVAPCDPNIFHVTRHLIAVYEGCSL